MGIFDFFKRGKINKLLTAHTESMAEATEKKFKNVNWDDMRNQLEDILLRSEKINHRLGLALGHCFMGNCLFCYGCYLSSLGRQDDSRAMIDEAGEHYEKSLSIAYREPDLLVMDSESGVIKPAFQHNSMNYLNYLLLVGRFDRAMELTEKLIEPFAVSCADQDPSDLMQVYFELAVALEEYLPKEAAALKARILELGKKTETGRVMNPDVAALLLSSLAKYERNEAGYHFEANDCGLYDLFEGDETKSREEIEDHLAKADQYYAEAQKLAAERDLIQSSLHYLQMRLIICSDPDKGIALANEFQEIMKKTPDLSPVFLAQAKLHLLSFYERKGLQEEAAKTQGQAVEIFENEGRYDVLAMFALNKYTKAKNGNAPQAGQWLDKANAYAAKLPQDGPEACGIRIKIADAAGDEEEVVRLSRQRLARCEDYDEFASLVSELIAFEIGRQNYQNAQTLVGEARRRLLDLYKIDNLTELDAAKLDANGLARVHLHQMMNLDVLRAQNFNSKAHELAGRHLAFLRAGGLAEERDGDLRMVYMDALNALRDLKVKLSLMLEVKLLDDEINRLKAAD